MSGYYIENMPINLSINIVILHQSEKVNTDSHIDTKVLNSNNTYVFFYTEVIDPFN